MLYYEAEWWGLNIFFRWQGSVITSSKVWPSAVFGAVLTALTPWYEDIHILLIKKEVDLTSYFQCLFLVLSFLLVVRVSLAYQRLDIANGSMLQTISLLLDQQLHVCSFVRLAPGLELDAETAKNNIEKLKWKHHMHNLLYAYCALVVAKLRGEDSLMTFKEIMEKYQITLTEVEKLSLELAGHRHYSIEGFMTQMWTEMMISGDVAVPPPFSSQTFRVSFETSDKVMTSLQIVSTPYPYPLAQAQGFLLHAFLFTLPLIVGLYLKNAFLAPFVTFVSICSAFGLTRLCEEMEDPFGIDANDLPLYRMLQCYRETLQTTLISNTPSAQPHVGLFIAIKKMAKTLPSDYPLKAGSPEYENMNRLCILKTGSTVEEYLRAPWEIERDQEIERDNAMLGNLRNMFLVEDGTLAALVAQDDEENEEFALLNDWVERRKMFSVVKRKTLGKSNRGLDYTKEVPLTRSHSVRSSIMTTNPTGRDRNWSGGSDGAIHRDHSMENMSISADGIQLEEEDGKPFMRLNQFVEVLDMVNDKAHCVRTDVKLFKPYK
jgi:predicted membrane chloride channel (bestrophin family)